MLTFSQLAKKSRTLAELVLNRDWNGIQERFYHPRNRFLNLSVNLPCASAGQSAELKQASLSEAKERFTRESHQILEEFLSTGATLELPRASKPDLTIVIVLYNRAELTLRCLLSLSAQTKDAPSFKVIIFDNKSTDQTGQLLSRISGADILRNSENIGYLEACNRALRPVETGCILLLNNDTIVHPGAIEAAYKTLTTQEKAGAVGARIVLPDGTLQEAGNIMWNDGTCIGFGRGLNPNDPSVRFRRKTDYCSGAFLMTRADLWQKIGGYDTRYKPAYYEETDFCMELQKLGYDVWYEPRASITHFEFGSAGPSQNAIDQMNVNREKFAAKHAGLLETKPASGASVLFARELKSGPHILVIEDYVPHSYLGAGFPRINSIVQSFVSSGWQVTLFATFVKTETWSSIYSDLPPTVEVVSQVGIAGLKEFLRERSGYYDVCWVCRPHNMEWVAELIEKKIISKQALALRSLIYDAEALFSEREALEKKIRGVALQPAERSRSEFEVVAHADAIVSVCEPEAAVWAEKTAKKVFVIGHDHVKRFSQASFAERQHILFMGSIHSHPSPNSDSLLWFLEKVWPLLKPNVGADVKIRCVGYNSLRDFGVFRAFEDDLEWVGAVPDLAPYFNSCRLMIVPTRYASGIPQKVYDAASYGMPMVCSALISKQMGWQNGIECLSASTDQTEQFAAACFDLYTNEEVWNRVRQSVMQYVEKNEKEQKVSEKVKKLLDQFFVQNFH